MTTPTTQAAMGPAPRSAPDPGSVLTVRDLRWPDLGEAIALEAELFGAEAWSADTWWQELAGRPRRDYLAAIAGPAAPSAGLPRAGLAGYAGADHGGETSDVMTIAVAPWARGHGLGARLLAELESRALARGAAAMLLEVRADNEPALALYRGAGYDVVQTRRRYYQPGDVDALVMRKHLGQEGIR